MKKNYRVIITDGKETDSFKLLGSSREAVRKLCEIVHIGTGWIVKDVKLAMKKDESSAKRSRQLTLF